MLSQLLVYETARLKHTHEVSAAAMTFPKSEFARFALPQGKLARVDQPTPPKEIP